MESRELFLEMLVGQIRALDQFGTWVNKSDDDLIKEQYVRTKDELREIPIISDIDEMQIKDIRLIYQSVALAFEKITGIMASVVMEMSHEGFGRVVVFAKDIVLCEKYFKDAHRYSFRTYEKLEDEGEKFLLKAQEKYKQYKNQKE